MRGSIELVNVIVTVEDDHCDQINEVAEQLRAAGMSIESTMEYSGIIAGSIEPGKIEEISRLAGVAHVEAARQFQLAPPHSKVR